MQDRYAYYPGCLASLSAKELDTSTRAVAIKLGVELVDMESTTCCGAGDIHEAKPEYYLHLNARILSQAEALGCDTLLTICNVCTLNLRQANFILLGDKDVRARVNELIALIRSTAGYDPTQEKLVSATARTQVPSPSPPYTGERADFGELGRAAVRGDT